MSIKKTTLGALSQQVKHIKHDVSFQTLTLTHILGKSQPNCYRGYFEIAALNERSDCTRPEESY